MVIRLAENKRYSSRKYSDYPVIVDNKEDKELTLDSIVDILNTKEFDDKLFIKEHNNLHNAISYQKAELNKVRLENSHLKTLMFVMFLVLVIVVVYLVSG